jgi:hypothetical protein
MREGTTKNTCKTGPRERTRCDPAQDNPPNPVMGDTKILIVIAGKNKK